MDTASGKHPKVTRSHGGNCSTLEALEFNATVADGLFQDEDTGCDQFANDNIGFREGLG